MTRTTLMNINEYITTQENEFVKAFNDPAHFPVGIISEKRFPDYLGFNQQIEFIKKIKRNRAFTRTVHSGKQVEYWVHIEYTGYRKSFLNFLEKHYELDIEEIKSNWHVDHVLSKAFALAAGMKYVRLCLLKGKQNLSYGAKFEKKFLNMCNSKKDIFVINFLVAMKVLNIPILKSKQDYKERKVEINNSMKNKGVKFFMNDPIRELDTFFNMWKII